MLPPIIENLLAQVTPEERIYNDLSADIVVRIRKTMTERGISQTELAARLRKRPSEVHKLLSYGHNLTLQSIAKLSAALGQEIVQVSAAINGGQKAQKAPSIHALPFRTPNLHIKADFATNVKVRNPIKINIIKNDSTNQAA
jgi:transcriptional regulator with XRE-family HTH domain